MLEAAFVHLLSGRTQSKSVSVSPAFQGIRELCPSLSLSSVEGVLRKLVAAGELRREGNGKNTYYVRTT